MNLPFWGDTLTTIKPLEMEALVYANIRDPSPENHAAMATSLLAATKSWISSKIDSLVTKAEAAIKDKIDEATNKAKDYAKATYDLHVYDSYLR
jgi:hypothetical protein